MEAEIIPHLRLPGSSELFHDTVHAVCVKDCTAEQLDAWAGGCPDLEAKSGTGDRLCLVRCDGASQHSHASRIILSFF